jgi:hypothetical protein
MIDMTEGKSGMTEEWRPVPEWEDLYEVSNLGRVRRFGRPALKTQNDRAGYQVVDLVDNGRRKNAKVHRLVALAFIPPVPDHNEVNHIDGDKANNVVSNLEWSNRSKNLKHAANVLKTMHQPVKGKFGALNHNAKSYRVTAPDGSVRIITGIAQFSRENGLNPALMVAVSKGKRNHHKNWICEVIP